MLQIVLALQKQALRLEQQQHGRQTHKLLRYRTQEQAAYRHTHRCHVVQRDESIGLFRPDSITLLHEHADPAFPV